MKKYIVKVWCAAERQHDTLEQAEADKKGFEESNKYRDIKIFEVDETRKEI